MFDIKKFFLAEVPDHYTLPSTGDSREKGDSWKAACEKINGALAEIADKGRALVETADEITEGVVDRLKAAFTSTEEHDALTARVKELEDKIEQLMKRPAEEAAPAPVLALEGPAKADEPQTGGVKPAPLTPPTPALKPEPVAGDPVVEPDGNLPSDNDPIAAAQS